MYCYVKIKVLIHKISIQIHEYLVHFLESEMSEIYKSVEILKDNGQFPEGWVGQEAEQLKDGLKYSLKYQAFYCTQHSIIN